MVPLVSVTVGAATPRLVGQRVALPKTVLLRPLVADAVAAKLRQGQKVAKQDRARSLLGSPLAPRGLALPQGEHSRRLL